MERIPFLDNIKAILIILVIIGHAIQFCFDDYEQLFAFRIIYSFHMPLFFFVSGFLANRGAWDKTVIKKRATQLLIPFAAWAFLTPFLKHGSFDSQASLNTFIYPDKGLWFLYNLFVYSTILNFAEYMEQRFKVKRIVTAALFYLLSGLLVIIFHTKFNCSQICYHYIFYTMGYFYREIQTKNIEHRKLSCWILFLLYVISVPFWTTNGASLFYLNFSLGPFFIYLFRIGVQVIGMLFFFNMGELFLNKHISVMHMIGGATLGIYAFHFVILHHLVSIIPIENNIIKSLIVSFLVFLFSYTFVVCIRRTRYLKILIIGN